MQINFYSEFPRKNLQKLKLIRFPSRVFIAAKSVKAFQKLQKQAKKINNKIKPAYWPLVKNSYWTSPFSNTKDLIELFNKLEKTNSPLLIDLEFPVLNKKLIFKNFLNFRKNKKQIKQFLEKNKKRITTAQSPFPDSKIMKFFGLDYNINLEKSLMWYSSMHSISINKQIKKNLIKIKNKENYIIGLGTIATGILKDEPILSPENLEKDLEFIKQIGFKKACIFRIGGLNKRYIKIINKFR